MTLPELVVFRLLGPLVGRQPNGDWVLRRDVPRIFKYLYKRQSRVKIAVSAEWDPQLTSGFLENITVEIKGVRRSLKSLIAPGCLFAKVWSRWLFSWLCRPHATPMPVIAQEDGSPTKYWLSRIKEASGVALSKMLVFESCYAISTDLDTTFYTTPKDILTWDRFKSGLKQYDDEISSDDDSDRAPACKGLKAVSAKPPHNAYRHDVLMQGLLGAAEVEAYDDGASSDSDDFEL
ncbi:hypothetical protein B0H17DRAFT_1075507 [Mycena rosella]|uniref:Uncharacterized protein n=1 Tax=Mycena rosella TaxID=1033263 RepID=A0AAD7D7N2_MYCRO|nr:hypothetical protein B0H17DRAFT_1075507 [Mycena rosella]